jgi:hypothetical protein
MFYAAGPCNTKHAEAGSAHYTTIVIGLPLVLVVDVLCRLGVCLQILV